MNPLRLLVPAALLLVLGTRPAWALSFQEGVHSDSVRFLFVLAVMLAAGKLSAEIFERFGQPAVVGELIAGVILGGSLLGVIPVSPDDPLTEIIALLAEIGVLVLLFEIGLETDLKQMFRVGPAAGSVAAVGVVMPFMLGVVFWLSFAPDDFNIVSSSTTAIFIGATLTATSVGITARVLTDIKVMSSLEAKLIIGAAVIDDVLGLVLLGLVATLAVGAAVGVWDVAWAFAVAVGFLVVAVAVGFAVAPRLFGLIDRMQVRGVLLVAAFVFLLLIAALADRVGSAMIIGAFAAGIILSRTNQFDLIEDRIKPVADIFTPIFFLSIGAQLDVRLLNPFAEGNGQVLALAAALFGIAVVGKLAAGWAVPWRRFNRLGVGIGMIPRGEVGLIFANIGLTTGVLGDELFSAVVLMVIGTTFVAPPLLKWSFGRWGTASVPVD
ncbi:MAG: cation:proton antiporter [Gemmatimonadetes bacterium]|nr:cation:proton antiporter [Gemmatimonadota bacterium]